MLNGSVAWFNEAVDTDVANSVPIVDHLAGYCKGASALIRPFALWSLNISKNFLSNSALEHGFSILTIFKSKYRSQLGDDKLRIPLIMRTEPAFDEVAFDDFYAGFAAFLMEIENGTLNKKLRGKRRKTGASAAEGAGSAKKPRLLNNEHNGSSSSSSSSSSNNNK